jgi:phospholipid/cholesterol/gamma-HCH transport system substrate-binding protein
MPLKRSSEIKVGFFALVVLASFLVAVFVLTSKTSLFRRTIALHTKFKDVAGLISGSEVRLAGVSIGSVGNIRFAPTEGSAEVLVEFTVDDRGMDRVMKDSKASIASLGLLGKKYLEILPGSLEAGHVAAGDTLESVEPASIAEAMEKAGKVIDNVGETVTHLKKIFASISGEEGAETDLSRAIGSVRHIVGEVETGKGVLHDLIYEPTKAQILTDLQATVHRISEVVERIQVGPGNIHEVVYGEQVKKLMDNVALTSDALRQTIVDIKQEKGIIHGLIYDPEKYQLLEDLRKTAANLAEISQRIERGEGTVGGLIVDPTIYEDLKKLTGEVERNRVLKTYIRYVVKKREADRELQEVPPAPPPPRETSPAPLDAPAAGGGG